MTSADTIKQNVILQPVDDDNPFAGDYSAIKAELAREDAELKAIKDAIDRGETERPAGICRKCQRERRIYPVDLESWRNKQGICGTCWSRQARRINAGEGRMSRRGY